MTNATTTVSSTVPRASATVEIVWLRVPDDVNVAATNRALLSASERDRADRFAFVRDSTRYIVGRAGLRRLLSARLGVPADAIAFETTAYGKPMLAACHATPDLQFNISHSGDIVVYALTQGRAVGIDVEAIETRVDRDSIARDYFSVAEHAAYAALDPAIRPIAFMNCWTRKEAFIKAVGKGLSYPLRSFDVSLTPGEDARLLRLSEGPGTAGDWTLASFEPCPGYVGAVVVEGRGGEGRITLSRAGKDFLISA